MMEFNYKESTGCENCGNCYWFTSYEDFYEDPLEDFETGTCDIQSDPHVSIEDVCDKHKKINDEKN